MVRNVEEVRAAQMVVALLDAGPQRRSIDFRLERHVRWIVRVEVHRPSNILEQATDPRHHHVAGPKLCLGMTRLEEPAHGTPSSRVLLGVTLPCGDGE